MCLRIGCIRSCRLEFFVFDLITKDKENETRVHAAWAGAHVHEMNIAPEKIQAAKPRETCSFERRA